MNCKPYIRAHADELLESLAALVRIPSIESVPEEHAPFGGLGSMVSQVLGRNCPRKMGILALPDAPVITGTSKEVFDYYGLNAEGIAAKAMELLA